MKIRTAPIALIFVLALATGCSDAPEADVSKPAQDSDGADTDFPVNDHPIPGMAFTEYCAPNTDLSPPSLEAWLLAADAVLVGRVESVVPVFEPACTQCSSTSGRSLEDPADCKYIDAALDIVLTQVQTLTGSAPGTITLRMGTWELIRWRPRPYAYDYDPELKWTSDEGSIEPGQWIGGALYHAAEIDRWTPGNGRPLLQLLSSGKIRLQSMLGECLRRPPEGLEGATVADLESVIATADPSDTGVAADVTWLRERVPVTHDDYSLSSSSLFLARCILNDPEDDGGCLSDDGCGPSQQCVNGVCQ